MQRKYAKFIQAQQHFLQVDKDSTDEKQKLEFKEKMESEQIELEILYDNVNMIMHGSREMQKMSKSQTDIFQNQTDSLIKEQKDIVQEIAILKEELKQSRALEEQKCKYDIIARKIMAYDDRPKADLYVQSTEFDILHIENYPGQFAKFRRTLMR